MELDLADRRTLVKSWLATLHGPELTVRPAVVGPLPSWGPLLRTALSWHIAYALVAYAGAMVISRQGSTTAVAQAVQQGGRPAVVVVTIVFWWGGVALTTLLWWVNVRRLRASRG
jgi:hypothetical protein